jgi:hypothetical protein
MIENVEPWLGHKTIQVVDPDDCFWTSDQQQPRVPLSKGVDRVEIQTIDLEQLVLVGRQQGFLTYEQVNEYLPDEANTAEKLDQLLVVLERAGINIVDEAETDLRNELKIYNGEDAVAPTQTDTPKLTNDPIRLYLSQMCEIPLLNRDQEIALAKKIEITRRKFRRAILGNDFALRQTVEVLRKVAAGILPFDRTIKVSLTERLTKEQVGRRSIHCSTIIAAIFRVLFDVAPATKPRLNCDAAISDVDSSRWCWSKSCRSDRAESFR